MESDGRNNDNYVVVNQDDPTAYHLYYGDELGRPDTILTFFN